VEIKLAPTMPALFQEIENDARSGGGLFDAYYTNPVIMGTAAVLNGFLDLTPFVKESPLADWTDILLALRTYVTSFEDKIYIILLDGDTHTMFYRKDVLEAFNLKVPRTWNEYTEVAKAIHGKEFNGITLSGSCVSRIQGDHAMFWSHLVLSTITQTGGTDKGSLFDTKDMTPLTGEAAAEMLRIHEEHMKYGSDDGK
jgi:multiple sugar transport system substrate-binding protein